MLFHIKELAVFRDLSPTKNRPASMLERTFDGESVVAMAVGGLASPGERPGKLPSRRNFMRVEGARGPAFLIDSGLELLRSLDVSPAAVQGELGCGIPLPSDRGGIERRRLDVPAMLIRLAAIKAADLDLHPIEY